MDAMDVLVVGAGPVGLALAMELELAGVHAVVVEQLTDPDPVPKARGIGVLGSEALRRRGLATPLQQHDYPGRDAYIHEMGSDRGHFAWIDKLDSSVLGSDNRSGAMIAQPALERLLAERAVGLGADVRRGHRIVELHQDDAEVHVVTETAMGARKYHAPYAVGCDGGRSAVRKLAGFDFPGIDSTMLTRIARIRPTDPTAFPPRVRTAQGTLQYRGFSNGWVRVRLSEPEDATNTTDNRSPMTCEEIHDTLERVTGIDVDIAEVDDTRRMRDSTRQAADYRRGRIILAGDAAHVHSPAGGQGLNLGLMDAVNLGWKLAAVVFGTVDKDGAEQLLDSYTRERHPVGARVIANTLAQAALLDTTPHVNALREIISDLMDFPDVRTYLDRRLSGVDVRYRLPYAIEPEHELLGTHVTDIVVDDTTLYTLLSNGHPLLLHTPPATDAAVIAAAWADRVTIRPALLLGRRDLAAALIRPDGVLAWASTPGDPPNTASLATALRTWFGQPQPTAGR